MIRGSQDAGNQIGEADERTAALLVIIVLIIDGFDAGNLVSQIRATLHPT